MPSPSLRTPDFGRLLGSEGKPNPYNEEDETVLERGAWIGPAWNAGVLLIGFVAGWLAGGWLT